MFTHLLLLLLRHQEQTTEIERWQSGAEIQITRANRNRVITCKAANEAAVEDETSTRGQPAAISDGQMKAARTK
jgi:hypothetical protein